MDVEHATNGWAALGALVRDARKQLGLSQTALVDLLNRDLEERDHPRVQQSVVSDNERGERWRDRPELVGAYTRVLRLGEEEVTATLYGVRRSRPATPTLAEIVNSDPSLDEESKDHILRQYELLRAATMHNRLHRGKRAVADAPERSEVSDSEMALIEQHFAREQHDAGPDSGNTASA